jgi:hypothetical protein
VGPAGYRRLLCASGAGGRGRRELSGGRGGQVEAAFAGAADAYRAQGLTPTLVDVGWAYLDEGGGARRHSSYRYLLRRPGQLGIQVVVDTTAP